MKSTTSIIFLCKTIITCSLINGFTFIGPQRTNGRTKPLNMGLFDGMKEAFSAPERSTLGSERETPIDRWMGWNVSPTVDDQNSSPGSKAPDNFVDSMDTKNYVIVEIEKPMGIVFEENDNDFGGMFLLSLKEGGNADKKGVLEAGDQLIAVGDKRVSGISFDDALGTIVATEEDVIKLIFFRGDADMFYGPTGASQDWLDEFISSS